MKLSEHFSLDEFTLSQTAVRNGILNVPDEFAINNLKALSLNVLEPIRKALGKEIHISSGYRSHRVNKLIGGATNSQHVYGMAADISAKGMTTEELYIFIKTSGISFDQLIQEFDRWVHVSYSISKNRNQCLRAKRVSGKVKYVND